MNLPRKGWARIYALNSADIEEVKAIIKEMDPFEFDYMPSDMVAHFSRYPELVYTHKFDSLDMNALTAICWSRGIYIWVCGNGYTDFMADATKPKESE